MRLRGAGACPEAQWVRKGDSAACPRECSISDPKVPTASFLHPFDTHPVPYPVLGTEDTAVNKMGQNHCPFGTDSSVQETEKQPMTRKKIYPQITEMYCQKVMRQEKGKKIRQEWAVWVGGQFKNSKDEGGSHMRVRGRRV